MSREQQKGVITAFPLKGPSKLRRSHGSLKDVTSVLNNIGEAYDIQYTELCHLLEDVVGSMEYVEQHRMMNISALHTDIEQLVNAVDKVRKATNANAVEKYRNDMKRLEGEKRQLLKEILEAKDDAKELRSKLQHVEQQMSSTRQECQAITDQSKSELPSLEYMKKLLHRLSKVFLTSKGDSRTIQGFVPKKGSKDVRPFRFDESTSYFDQVNTLWDIVFEECC